MALGQAGFQVFGIMVVVLTGFTVALLNGICLRISARKCGNQFPRRFWFEEHC